MNPTSDETYRRLWGLRCTVLRLCVPALLAVSVLTVAAARPLAPPGPPGSRNPELLLRSRPRPAMAVLWCRGRHPFPMAIPL